MDRTIGGKLIDTGGFSCIFNPALRCKIESSKKIQGRVISKLMKKDHAMIEWHISERVRQIPLWKNYFSVSEHICELSNTQVDTDIKSKCSLVRKHPLSQLRILQMPYSGKIISTYSFPSTFNMMEFVIHILEAGALLLVNNIIHFDIHDKNIVINDHQVPHIIDFNLSLLVHEVNDLFHDYTPLIHLPQFSPDYIALLGINHNIPMDRIIYDVIHAKHIKYMINILGISPNKVMMDLKYVLLYQSEDIMEWFNRHWSKIDSWAIGMYIVYMIRRHSIMLGGVFKTNPKLKKTLSKLCAINPNERWDCMQALHFLHPNSIIIKRYGQNWLDKHGRPL